MCHCGAVVKELLARADEPGSTPGDAVFCFFVPFFFFLFGLFFNTIFPFGLFFFILTADPAGHALGSIYILSLSLEFYFGKKKMPVPLYIVLINHIITLKSPLGQLPPQKN